MFILKQTNQPTTKEIQLCYHFSIDRIKTDPFHPLILYVFGIVL